MRKERLVLGIDLETTGLPDNPAATIIEVGATLWCPDRRESLGSISMVVNPRLDGRTFNLVTKSDGSLLSPGLSLDVIWAAGVHLREAIDALSALGQRATYYCAHNASFEQHFLKGLLNYNLPWLDTMLDGGWARPAKWPKLDAWLAQNSVINPCPHRAGSDASAMLWAAHNYGWDRLIAAAEERLAKEARRG